jgi:hypothetical protein
MIGLQGAEIVIISILTSSERFIDANYRGIIRSKTGERAFWISNDEIKKLTPKYWIAAIQTKFPTLHELSIVDTIQLSNALLEYDHVMVYWSTTPQYTTPHHNTLQPAQGLLFINHHITIIAYLQQKVARHKFGVVYSNNTITKPFWEVDLEDTSPAFVTFLDFLGQRIELQGWPHYAGDLDTKCMLHSHIIST